MVLIYYILRFLWSGGTTYFPFVTLSHIVCASTIMIWELFENYSSYAVVAMMIERCIVVIFPIHSIHLVTRRFTVILLCICILPSFLTLIPISAFYLGVQTNSSSSADGVFCGFVPDRPGFSFFIWDLTINRTLHVIITGILVVVLCVAIAYHRRRKRQLIMKQKEEVRGVHAVKEHSTIIIMLLI